MTRLPKASLTVAVAVATHLESPQSGSARIEDCDSPKNTFAAAPGITVIALEVPTTYCSVVWPVQDESALP